MLCFSAIVQLVWYCPADKLLRMPSQLWTEASLSHPANKDVTSCLRRRMLVNAVKQARCQMIMWGCSSVSARERRLAKFLFVLARKMVSNPMLIHLACERNWLWQVVESRPT